MVRGKRDEGIQSVGGGYTRSKGGEMRVQSERGRDESGQSEERRDDGIQQPTHPGESVKLTRVTLVDTSGV